MIPSTGLFTDTEAKVVGTSAVLIYSPAGKRNRKRFPENCVQLMVDEDEALRRADPDKGFHAAIASGPARSSEGFKLFYLIRWLD
ncbi:MAG: hypothetical protein ACYC4K_03465 [Thiobacillus sp.]